MKIYLKIPNNKKYLREIGTDDLSIGVLPLSNLPFSFRGTEDEPVFEKEISEGYFEELKHACLSFAKNKLLDYLAKSEKTKYDCTVLLKRYQIPDNLIKDLINWAEEQKYLSDERYAEMYIQEAMLNCKSKAETAYKLKQKRIDSSIINKKIAELYSIEARDELLDSLIDQLLRHENMSDKKAVFEKCATKLYRKGFHYDDFRTLLYKKINNLLDE